MSRTLPEESQEPLSQNSGLGESGASSAAGRGWEIWVVRAAVIAGITVIAATLRPFGLQPTVAAAAGFGVAIFVIVAELRLRRAESSAILGAAAGALVGAMLALLATLVIARTTEPESSKSFLEFSLLLGLGYLGLVLGGVKGLRFDSRVLRGAGDPSSPSDANAAKLLDTSVLIDGRIADICEARFLDGPLLVPPFVLNELQTIADSSDTLRRQRGRRGLEVLQRIQKLPHMQVRVLENVGVHVSAQGADVDHQLVELARRMHAKIVTNDFNLNKVATVQGISVLNVNELANALRPAVLPGEPMRVFILREGKEASQGVAYLEDGTMVVVDGARRSINKTVDITVTSVHQTPAGKMIFGRLEDRGDQHPAAKQGSERSGRSSAESEIQ